VSPSIWTECGGRSNAGPLQLSPWRVVESQFVNSTRKLVDSDAEQGLLEELIDGAKPPVPADLAALGLHYLLFTPFRHPPLRHGSRFGRKNERGIFYGAREPETCLAEVAYYRFVFLSGTSAQLPMLVTRHTAFQAEVRPALAVDLTRPPFDAHRATISSATRYEATQRLGGEMRSDGVEVALYLSARARAPGVNVAVFSPKAFASKQPYALHEWDCITDPEKVEFKRRNLIAPSAFTYPRKDFLFEGRLPAPAVD
jgi:hypothetical protein